MGERERDDRTLACVEVLRGDSPLSLCPTHRLSDSSRSTQDGDVLVSGGRRREEAGLLSLAEAGAEDVASCEHGDQKRGWRRSR